MSAFPVLVAVLVGVVVGLARGGRLRAVALARVRRPALLAFAVAVSVFVDLADVGPAAPLMIAALAAGLGFALSNLRLTGMAVVAIGIASNLAPLTLNMAMPVRGGALVEAEMIAPHELDRVVLRGARELSDDDTMLAALGDTFPVRLTHQVVSIGDLVMMVGLADVVANLLLRRRRRRLPPSARPALAALGWREELIDLTGDPVVPLPRSPASRPTWPDTGPPAPSTRPDQPPAGRGDDAVAASMTTASPVQD